MALCDGERIIARQSASGGPAANARLTPFLQTILADSGLTPVELDGLAVTVGPGAFTGLRVGLAFVKGLAMAIGKPVVPLSSLELLAMNAQGSQLPVCAMYDARKSEVYAAVYDCRAGLKPVIAETVADPAAFLGNITTKTLFIGDGAVRYGELIKQQLGDLAVFADPAMNVPQAAAGVTLALAGMKAGKALSPAALLPSYLRLPEAELARAARIASL